ncbi:hypothetical protein EGI22_09770 [Lacihabitans sp. LS3-19]|uniref:hypothetical protein n=1 Tax=Lacihabitans sp. LS3-19 TaxID=2487335 RepID=UPI0020CE0927|nr:hypothetical protein [Lacihabitans sp. LS3-19]MCP9768199.1 hypothetical protein [Lacihabitans sp. LS3-19]
MRVRNLSFIIILFFCYNGATAQKPVVNEEINITKEREVVLPKANRIIDKIPPVENEKKEKKMTYSFFDRKPTAVEETKFVPNVVSPITKKSTSQDNTGYKNYFKVGMGNFGRIYAETYINSNQDRKFVYGISGLHNSTKRGPIGAENSATSLSKIGVDGKYHQNNYELKLDMGYENRGYYFYGYDTVANRDYTQQDLKQRLNFFNFAATLENTNPKPKVDYSLTTGIKNLSDNYSANELDWGTKFKSHFPLIEDKVTATLSAEAYITERSDLIFQTKNVRKRNLYRVEPGFKFDFGKISAKIGFKAVNEYEQIEKINNTKGFPTASITYKTPSLTYFFVGFDGDIIRNTLHSFINENPFLAQAVDIKNTNKNQEYYIGSRAELYNGLSYNLKISYGKYQNLYYFNKGEENSYETPSGSFINVTKFQVEYEEASTDFANISAEFGYSNFEHWKSNLKLDYNYYETVNFTKPYHRPAFTSRWGNTFLLSDKLVSSFDIYYLAGIYARDLDLGEPVKLKDIVDLNAEMTYLFSKQFSAFVKLNNIVGQNYQRYYNYPQMGLNFVAGINVAL